MKAGPGRRTGLSIPTAWRDQRFDFDRATVRRLPQRGAYDAETIHAILDVGFLAHVGFCVEGQPFVIPTLYGRVRDAGSGPDKLCLHGSAASRMLRELSTGVPACVTVTHVDGIVLARSAFHHSMNYRSVVAFGTARKIDDVQGKAEALRVISDHLIAGRWEDVRNPNGEGAEGYLRAGVHHRRSLREDPHRTTGR